MGQAFRLRNLSQQISPVMIQIILPICQAQLEVRVHATSTLVMTSFGCTLRKQGYYHKYNTRPTSTFYYRAKRTHVIVEGDAKLYEIFQSLKLEYGDELKWLLIYPGDWHLLKNYQIALVKPYFETGLKELAKACKYPLAAIKSCSQFKRSHNFILEAWESVYRVMVERFTESSNAPLTTDCVVQAMKDITSAGANKGDTSKLINNIASFKAVFSESNFFDKLNIFC